MNIPSAFIKRIYTYTEEKTRKPIIAVAYSFTVHQKESILEA